MYLQVFVHSDDQYLQQIVCRASESKPQPAGAKNKQVKFVKMT